MAKLWMMRGVCSFVPDQSLYVELIDSRSTPGFPDCHLGRDHGDERAGHGSNTMVHGPADPDGVSALKNGILSDDHIRVFKLEDLAAKFVLKEMFNNFF